ncbi:hypothetical protein [Nocardiopsis coralliicola]
MRWLRRLGPDPLPAGVRAGLRTERGERVLAHSAPLEGGAGYLVATTLALHLPGGRRVPWQEIDRAHWDDDGLHVTEAGRGEQVVAAGDPGQLAGVVHERVTATILASHRVTVPGGGVRLVARRSPGGSAVEWRSHPEEGVDAAAPEVRAAVTRALAALREGTGV